MIEDVNPKNTRITTALAEVVSLLADDVHKQHIASSDLFVAAAKLVRAAEHFETAVGVELSILILEEEHAHAAGVTRGNAADQAHMANYIAGPA